MKRALLRGASAATLVFVGGLWASQAMAQSAPQAAAAADQAASGQVIVTAEKRSQRIERVPVAVSAFTAKQREVLGIKTVQQLSDFTPGLSYYAIADRAYIRGIGRNTVNLATESGVATYYNGVYYGANASIAQAHDSLFIGNIEVDRGPQNTLHGSNSDGGTINYVSQRPTHSFYAEARVGAQDYNEFYGEAVVSGPITDNVRFRVGGNYSDQSGGFFKNLIGKPEGGYLPQGNGGNSEYFEAQVDANIGAHLDAWAMASTGDYDTNFHTVATVGAINDYEFNNAAGSLTPGAFYGLCGLAGHGGDAGCAGGDPIVPGSVVTTAINASQFPGNNPSNLNLHRFIETSNQQNRQTRDIALATVWTYHFPSADLQYIGGYQQFYYDLDFGAGADAGVTQYKLQGASAPVAAFGCGSVINLTGAALAACTAAAQQPLTINPAGLHTSFIEDEQYFSHELNLISTAAGPLQWVGGLYWYHEHFNQPIAVGCYPFQTQLTTPDQILPFAIAGQLVAAPINHSSCTVNLDGFATYDSIAGYGQVTWQIDPQWKLEGAARYTDDRKTGGEQFRVIAFNVLHPGLLGAATPSFDVTPVLQPIGVSVPGSGPSMVNANTGFVTRTLHGSWNAVTGDATLTWTPDSETLAYARYARGYKTGGFNSGTISAHPLTQPEYVDSFEIGAKKSIGSVLQVNAAAFYYSYANDQQPLSVQSSPGVTASQIFNIPSVHTYGLELEGVWRPIDPLTIIADYSFLNATVNSLGGKCVVNADDPLAIEPGDKTAGCAISPAGVPQAVNIVGNTLAESPKNKIALNAQYVFTFDPGKLTLSASYIWKDKTYGAIFNVPTNQAPAYSQVNLRATWDGADGRYTVTGFIDNVFNTTGFDNVSEAQLGPNALAGAANYDTVRAVGLTYPLTFGAELQVRFR